MASRNHLGIIHFSSELREGSRIDQSTIEDIRQMLPNFIVIGSQKAGTTSLYRVLSRHPEIFMPEKKELNFFFRQGEYEKGISYYEEYFEAAPARAKTLGEASPGYICHPEAAARIAFHMPNVKLILTVRNPVDRAYSQYWSDRRHLSQSLSFEEAVEHHLETSYEPGRVGYFSRGVYAPYIREYLEHFDRSQLLILSFDELRNRPTDFYHRCFEFLGVDPAFDDPAITHAHNPSSTWDNPAYNFFIRHPGVTRWLPKRGRGLLFKGKRRVIEYPPMHAEVESKLLDFYEPWNSELSKLLGMDLSAWKK